MLKGGHCRQCLNIYRIQKLKRDDNGEEKSSISVLMGCTFLLKEELVSFVIGGQFFRRLSLWLLVLFLKIWQRWQRKKQKKTFSFVNLLSFENGDLYLQVNCSTTYIILVFLSLSTF